MAGILIDTNLLVYLFDQKAPKKQSRARETLDLLELSRAGRLGVQNLAEFISVATRKLHPPMTPAQALEKASLFARVWPVFDLTPLVVFEAARGVRDYSLSYYDAQVWATAHLNQVSLVLSEDFQDGSILEGVRFVNPFSLEFDIHQWV